MSCPPMFTMSNAPTLAEQVTIKKSITTPTLLRLVKVRNVAGQTVTVRRPLNPPEEVFVPPSAETPSSAEISPLESPSAYTHKVVQVRKPDGSAVKDRRGSRQEEQGRKTEARARVMPVRSTSDVRGREQEPRGSQYASCPVEQEPQAANASPRRKSGSIGHTLGRVFGCLGGG